MQRRVFFTLVLVIGIVLLIAISVAVQVMNATSFPVSPRSAVSEPVGQIGASSAPTTYLPIAVKTFSPDLVQPTDLIYVGAFRVPDTSMLLLETGG